MKKIDVAIIGAGPSGIFCARELVKSGKNVVIFERTNEVGGRVGSKKIGEHVFNFGVNSFHNTAEELNEMVEHGVENETLIRDNVEIDAKCAVTQWAQGLVKGIEVRLGHNVERIEHGDNENVLRFSDQEPVAAKDVILSVPAPQALEVLNASGLKATELDRVRYSSAIYYMVSLERELTDLAEFKVLQHVKKDKHYYLLCFQEDWSDKSSEELREEFDEVFKPIQSYVHKWKFAKAQKQVSSDCQMILKNKSIYLTGDYFYGDNVDSAALSAQGVLDEVFGID